MTRVKKEVRLGGFVGYFQSPFFIALTTIVIFGWLTLFFERFDDPRSTEPKIDWHYKKKFWKGSDQITHTEVWIKNYVYYDLNGLPPNNRCHSFTVLEGQVESVKIRGRGNIILGYNIDAKSPFLKLRLTNHFGGTDICGSWKYE